MEFYFNSSVGGELSQEESEILYKVTPFAQWLGSSNSCINPILYAFFNKKYRRGFAAIIQSRSCCARIRLFNINLHKYRHKCIF